MTFNNHPAFDALTQAFEAWDRDGIRQALQALNAAATGPKERTALGELGAQALQRLGLIVPEELPPSVDRQAVVDWTVDVAGDLLAAGALVNGSPGQQQGHDRDEEETWRWPVELACASRNWALVRTLLAHGAHPLVMNVLPHEEDIGDDLDLLNRSVIRAMLREPTAAVALDLLDVLDLSTITPRTDGERHAFQALSLHNLAEHPVWTMDDRMAVIRRTLAARPMFQFQDNDGAQDLFKAVANAHAGAVEARLLIGEAADRSTVKEIRMPASLLAGYPRTAMHGLMHEGYTPLHAAVLAIQSPSTAVVGNERWKILNLLLEHGASVHATTSFGATPLHLAALRGQLPVVELLLAHGADGLRPDVDGATPLVWAREAQHPAIATRLLEVEQQVLRAAMEEGRPADAQPVPAIARPRL